MEVQDTEPLVSHTQTSYDEVPYTSYPYPHSHPNRLAVVATLVGMTPARVNRCRVLELGAASGGNLIPLAATLPEASFIGVDLSGRQVAQGTKTIQALGLQNIELRCQSITDVDSAWGTFDYIICHGVYSWVPNEVRQKILQICAEQLNPHGVAYISYNTYPGWHMRGTVRDMMLYHVRKWNLPDERVRQARALLDFLVKTVPQSDAYSHLLRSELERVRNTADSYVLHEHLEVVNEPVYFYEFAETAAAKGVQFIAEAQSGARFTEALGPEADQIVRQLSRDVIEYEQYLDFLRNRMFRRSLLCRNDVTLDRNFDPKRILELCIASSATSQGPVQLQTNEEAKFQVEDGVLASGAPLLKAMLSVLGERWPEAIPFDELLETVFTRLSGGPAAVASSTDLVVPLSTNLIHCFIRRIVELYQWPPPVRAAAGPLPNTSALARLQASTQRDVTTLLHHSVALNDFDRKLVMLADGTRSRDQLLEGLIQSVRNGELVVVDSGGRTNDDQSLAQLLKANLDRRLSDFSQLGLWSL